jgi:geranylgeranyl diphosphate synthase type II
MNTMHSFDYLQRKLNRIFASVKIISEPKELYDPIVYTLSLGGKRIRPLLVLAGCDLYGGDLDKVINVAIGIELFHNFTLLHDDIMDQAPIRRGKDTVHKKWNANIAILSGDTMFSLATEYISQTQATVLPEVLQVFTMTARQVCEGQQYDMNFESQENVSLPDYMRMIRLKTAVLIACSLKLGAIVAGANTEEKKKIYTFGENLGLAFQLQDDLLDTFGEENKFGKEIGGDIVAKKKTFLYVKALELAGDKQRKELLRCLSARSMTPDEKIRRVKNLYRLLHVEEITKAEISDWFDKALQCLDQMDVGQNDKKELRGFAKRLLNRQY